MGQRHLAAARSGLHVPEPGAHPRVKLQQNLTVPQGRGHAPRGPRLTLCGVTGQTQRASGNTGSGGYLQKSTSAGAWLFHRFPGPLNSKLFEILNTPEDLKYLSFTFISTAG